MGCGAGRSELWRGGSRCERPLTPCGWPPTLQGPFMPPKKVRKPQKPDFTLELPAFLTMSLLPTLIGRAQPLLSLGPDEQFNEFIINGSRLSMASPAGLATLASIMLYASRNRKYTKGVWVVPNKPHVARYISRMNFHSLLRVAHDLTPKPRRAPRSGRFRELVEVANEDESIRVTDELAAVMRKRLPRRRIIVNNVSHCLSEILENVHHHAESSTNGVVCAQTYPKSGAVELAIADCGIGVRESLRKNPRYSTQVPAHADALRLAVQRGVTSTPNRNSGEGLFFVAELLKKAGRLYLQSGDALLTVNKKGVMIKAAPSWKGTLVGIRLERDVPIREIFDRFIPPEQGELPFFEVSEPQQ